MAKNKKSIQNLLGLKSISDYALEKDGSNYYIYFSVQPVNISVLSVSVLEDRIHQLMLLLSTVPNVQIICTDSCESFEGNKRYIQSRLEQESNPALQRLLTADLRFLDEIQLEMSTSRQYMLCVNLMNMKKEVLVTQIGRLNKSLSEHGLEIRLMNKSEIKRMLGIYFESSQTAELFADAEGAEHFDLDNLSSDQKEMILNA